MGDRRRYQAIVVTGEAHAQVERLTYILGHGVKEGLVARPEEWPGPHCARALRTGEPVHGVWISRTVQWAAFELDWHLFSARIRQSGGTD